MKEMDLDDFRDEGYLLEANRQFFHPLGIALFVAFDDDGNATHLGAHDDRDDPEGWYFNVEPDDVAKVAHIAEVADARREPRMARLGYWVQPVETLMQDSKRLTGEVPTEPESFYAVRRADGDLIGDYQWVGCSGAADWPFDDDEDVDPGEYEIVRMTVESVTKRTFGGPPPLNDGGPKVTTETLAELAKRIIAAEDLSDISTEALAVVDAVLAEVADWLDERASAIKSPTVINELTLRRDELREQLKNV